MKFDLIGSTSVGFFAVAGSWFAANGSSLTIFGMAMLGALVAVLELDPFTMRRAVILMLFNTLVGAFGVPFVLHLLGVEMTGLPAAAAVLLPFLLGWAAHTVLTQLRAGVIALAEKRLKGGGA